MSRSSNPPDTAPLTQPARAPRHSPLFVVSLWRAGSSLLYALLNKHPDVALMYEADFVLLKPVFVKSARPDWVERWEFLNSSVSRHDLPDAAMPATQDFREALAASHRTYAQIKGASVWGDKSPHYYDRLDYLADCFPGARFIIVWRDLFQTTSSIVRAGAKGSSYFSKRGMPLRAILGFQTLKRECDKLLARQIPVCQVNYEDLIRDPAATMHDVCSFLGLPYSDALSTIEGADRSATHAGEHHRLLRGNTIVADSRPDALLPALRRKVERYHSWYRKLHGSWPPYPHNPPACEFPSLTERIVDQILYRTFRRWDALVELIFCVAPLRLLSWYRQAKAKFQPDLASASPDLN